MIVNKNYNDENVSSISLVSDNEKINIFNAGSDLYWVLDKYSDDNDMTISIDDDFFDRLNKLFGDIKECDNQYDRCINNNQFIWYSEAYGEQEDAHKLIITRNDSFYSIKFFYNSNNQLFNVSGNCPICFCLSGSRNQRIANLFSEMFLEYQYDKDKKFVKSR